MVLNVVQVSLPRPRLFRLPLFVVENTVGKGNEIEGSTGEDWRRASRYEGMHAARVVENAGQPWSHMSDDGQEVRRSKSFSRNRAKAQILRI